MTSRGMHAFDTTVQESNVWLKTVMRHMGVEDEHLGEAALRTALHALRDRLGPENAVHLGAQLPMLIRGLYYESWRMAATPTKERHKRDFLKHIQAELPRGVELDTEQAARAVFALLWDRLDPGEVHKVVRVLPLELRELWPEAAQVG